MRYALTLCLTASVATVAAQAPAGDAAFELASIRQNISGSQSGGGKPRAGGGYGGVDVSAMLSTLTAASGRAVLDRTGLTGAYDFELKWTPALGTDAPPSDAVSIFTAVQEQPGLRLDSGTAPLDVLVIDRIERPSEN